MRLAIVEDLETDRRRLAGLIRRDCARMGESADISIYESGETFLEQYRPGSCDGVFLDILLGGISGIDTAKRIRGKEPRLPIIFTTTEPDFALDGFEVHAMDYLVKPVEEARVSWCMKELRGCLTAPAAVSLLEVSGWGHASPVSVPLDEILYGQYQNHCVEVHTTVRTICTRLSFQEFTERLPQAGCFVVCGRGLVVNLSQIERVGDSALLLRNGESIQFSRSRKQEIQRAFTEWAFARSRKGGWA